MTNDSVFTGVVHGNMIELDRAVNLPDGQPVTVVLQPANGKLAGGEGLRRSAGSWSDDAEGLDQYLDWNRQQRKRGRGEHAP